MSVSMLLILALCGALLGASCENEGDRGPARSTGRSEAPANTPRRATPTPAAPSPAAAAKTPAEPARPPAIPPGVTRRTLTPATAKAIVKRRPYELGIPPGLDRSRPSPLVLYLHGYGASPSKLRQVLGVADVAREAGFVFATPAGTKSSKRRRFWNATPACCDFENVRVDDVTYIAAVIEDAKQRVSVDQARIFVVGYSNGGFMAHRLACELSDRIAGIASVAGAGFLDDDRCRPSSPVAVLQIHGDADTIVSIHGGYTLGRIDLPAHPSAQASVARWGKLNGCGPLQRAPARLDLEDRLPGPETKVYRHQECQGGAAELWWVEGGGHFVAQSRSATRQIYGFLMAHPQPRL